MHTENKDKCLKGNCNNVFLQFCALKPKTALVLFKSQVKIIIIYMYILLPVSFVCPNFVSHITDVVYTIKI